MATKIRPAAAGAKRVVLHIGAPKTGTTYLQQTLFANRERLAADGVLYPYAEPAQSFRSAHDFCGRAWFGFSKHRFRGEWDEVAARTREWTGSTVILSSELLAGAEPDRVASRLSRLAPADLHVVFSARDLARQLVSDWQEQVKHRHTVTLETFVDDLVTHGIDAPEPFGPLFWGLHDPVRVLPAWARVVGDGRVHVLTIPQRSGPRDALWTRFCEVAWLDPAAYGVAAKRANRSMGIAETELVRRMNHRVRKLDAASYDALVRVFLAEKVLGRRSARLMLPPEHQAWVRTRSRALIDDLAAAGYAVHGDLEELMPAESATPYVSPTGLSDADLGPVAVRVATALLIRAGKLREQNLTMHGKDDSTSAPSALARRAARRLLGK